MEVTLQECVNRGKEIKNKTNGAKKKYISALAGFNCLTRERRGQQGPLEEFHSLIPAGHELYRQAIDHQSRVERRTAQQTPEPVEIFTPPQQPIGGYYSTPRPESSLVTEAQVHAGPEPSPPTTINPAVNVIDTVENQIHLLERLIANTGPEQETTPSTSTAQNPGWLTTWNNNLAEMTQVIQSQDQSKINDLRRRLGLTSIADDQQSEEEPQAMDTTGTPPDLVMPTASITPTEQPTRGLYPPAGYNTDEDEENYPRPRSKKNKRKKYNPRRHLTMEDYFSSVDLNLPSTSNGRTRREVQIDVKGEEARAKKRERIGSNKKLCDQLAKDLKKENEKRKTAKPPRKKERPNSTPKESPKPPKPVATITPWPRSTSPPAPQQPAQAPPAPQQPTQQRQPAVLIDLVNEAEPVADTITID